MELARADGTGPRWRIEVASSFLARGRGLMGRGSLPDGEGLYLPGTNSIHMLFMRFPIDCLFLGAPRPDGSREVVDVREHLAPWRGVVWWARGAKGAVELPQGAVARAGFAVGDRVRLS
jgi:uncharacterized membrane protein (UPF0127 family)